MILRVIRRCLVALFCAVAALAVVPMRPAAADPVAPVVPVVTLHGVLTGTDAERVSEIIAAAPKSGDPCVILDIDSPGGLPETIKRIVDAELGSAIPVITFAAPGSQVTSGALAILEAGGVVAMSETAQAGSVHAIDFRSTTFGTLPHDDAAGTLARLASIHGRDGTWPAEASRGGVVVQGTEIKRRGAIDLVAEDTTAVLNAINGKKIGAAGGGVKVSTTDIAIAIVGVDGWKAVSSQLTQPDLAFALLVTTALLIGLFIANPGGILFGLLAVMTGAGALHGFVNLPTNPLGVALVMLSFLLFVIDVKAPSHGALTAAGAVCMALGGWRLVDSGTLDIGVSTVLVAVTVLLITAGYASIVPKLVEARKMPYSDPQADLIGRVATVRETLQPHGYVNLGGALWRATTTHSPQPVGTKVRVLEIDGLRLTVEPAPAEDLTENAPKG